MNIVSVNVGLPRTVMWGGGSFTTGIYKDPVVGRIPLRKLNLDGDRQADLTVHGGVNKAVYVYPHEHYAYWKNALPADNLPFGSFGENFTSEGLDESLVNIGDGFRIGSAKVIVTQPRMPCYKLNIKFQRDDMVKLFRRSGRSGFYLAVLEEGQVAAGDTWELIKRDDHNVTVQDINRLYFRDEEDPNIISRAMEIEAFPKDWKDYFRERLTKENA